MQPQRNSFGENLVSASLTQSSQQVVAGRARKCVGRLLFALLVGYVAYFLLLGPFWALDGRGYIPDPIHRLVWGPALVWKDVPVAGAVIVAYLDWWYLEPQAAETTR